MFDAEVERLHEFCGRWRMSRSKAYRLMTAGKLPYHVVGAQRCFTRDDRNEFARRCAEKGPRCALLLSSRIHQRLHDRSA